MLTPPRRVYPDSTECIWVLFDTEDKEACELFHELRAFFQDRTDVEAVNDRYYVLFLFPGAALELLR